SRRRHLAHGGSAGHRRWASLRDYLDGGSPLSIARRARASAPATPAARARPCHGRGMVVRWDPPCRWHTGGTGPPVARAGLLAAGDARPGQPRLGARLVTERIDPGRGRRRWRCASPGGDGPAPAATLAGAVPAHAGLAGARFWTAGTSGQGRPAPAGRRRGD